MQRARIASFLATLVFCGCSGSTSPGGDPQKDGGGDLRQAGRVPKQHRPMAVTCPMDRPPGSMTGTGTSACKTDGDCTDGSKGKNGRCTPSRIGSICTYDTCFADGECGGKVCQCRAPATAASADTNHCLGEGDCRTDADCGGGYCSPSFGSCGSYSGTIAYYCHTAKDECIDDADCAGTMMPGYCAYNKPTGSWQCSSSVCAG